MRSARILFVEDDEDDAMLLRVVCKRADINAYDFASNGRHAMEMLRQDIAAPPGARPSVIFLDLNMPEVNGFDFLRWLREDANAPYVPVVILTTSENPNDIRTAYALGANAYLVKSSVLADLTHLISVAYSFWVGCNHAPGNG